MENTIYSITGVVALALSSLGVSNLMHDRGNLEPFGRRAASALGGTAYLLAVVSLDMAVAMTVLGGLTLLIIVLRLGLRRWVRGTQGKRSSQQWSQVTFAIAGTMSLAIGWWLLGDKWLGFLPVAFLAWGDNVAGLVRDLSRVRVNWIWPSVAMLAVSLAAAFLYHPYWIGSIGATAAALGERYRPSARFWDDNLNLVAFSVATMAILSMVG